MEIAGPGPPQAILWPVGEAVISNLGPAQSLLDLNHDAGIDWSGASFLDSPDQTIGSAMDWINPITPDARFHATNRIATNTHRARASSVQPHNLYEPMPWPDDMLASSERRFLWHYFVHAVKSDMLALDIGDVMSLQDFEDPYDTILPRIAQGSSALRGALLCVSAVQFHRLHDRQAFGIVARVISNETLKNLRDEAENPQGDDFSLLAMMTAASFLHYFGRDRRDDCLQLATSFALAFFARARHHAVIPPACLDMHLTAFRWSILSTLCSLRVPRKPLVSKEVCRIIELDAIEINQNFSATFKNWVSHPLYVFSPRLVNPLLRIGKLLELQLQLQDGNKVDEQELSLDVEIEEVEEMLVQARQADIDLTGSMSEAADPKAVLAMNEAMQAASLILVYARLKAIPHTAPFVRRQVQTVINEISQISSDSRMAQVMLFPLFTAGCETVDLNLREQILARLRPAKGVVFNNRADLCATLNHIWEIRDLQPGLAWPGWAQKVKPEFRIDCLF